MAKNNFKSCETLTIDSILNKQLKILSQRVALYPDKHYKFMMLNSHEQSIKDFMSMNNKQIDMQNLMQQPVDSQGNTLLHVAAAYNRSETINYLVKQHSLDVHAVNDKGRTPMHYAALNFQPEAGQALHNYGASAYQPDNYGHNACDYYIARMTAPVFEPASVLQVARSKHRHSPHQTDDNNQLSSKKGNLASRYGLATISEVDSEVDDDDILDKSMNSHEQIGYQSQIDNDFVKQTSNASSQGGDPEGYFNHVTVNNEYNQQDDNKHQNGEPSVFVETIPETSERDLKFSQYANDPSTPAIIEVESPFKEYLSQINQTSNSPQLMTGSKNQFNEPSYDSPKSNDPYSGRQSSCSSPATIPRGVSGGSTPQAELMDSYGIYAHYPSEANQQQQPYQPTAAKP